MKTEILLIAYYVIHVHYHFVTCFPVCIIQLGNADVVRALLVSGVDPSLKDEVGKTTFDIAKSSTQLTMVFYDVLLQSIAQSK